MRLAEIPRAEPAAEWSPRANRPLPGCARGYGLCSQRQALFGSPWRRMALFLVGFIADVKCGWHRAHRSHSRNNSRATKAARRLSSGAGMNSVRGVLEKRETSLYLGLRPQQGRGRSKQCEDSMRAVGTACDTTTWVVGKGTGSARSRATPPRTTSLARPAAAARAARCAMRSWREAAARAPARWPRPPPPGRPPPSFRQGSASAWG